jgi:hypothetical protein
VEELPPADTTVAEPGIAAAGAGESGAGNLVAGDLVADGGAGEPTEEAEPAASASVPDPGSPVAGPPTVSGAAADGPTHGDLARPFALRTPDLTAPSAGDQPGAAFGVETDGEPGQPAQRVIVPPAVSAGDGNRLPIFESVESDWFRRGRHGAEQPGSGLATAASGAPAGTASVPVAPAGWTSPADEGWRAAEVAQAPVSGGTTGAGLPKRVPKANLVPGGVGAGSAPAPAAPSRSAVQARDRLASFQRGVRQGRSAAGSDETPSGEENGG